MLLETTTKYQLESEVAAKEMIEKYRTEAATKGYVIKKASYEYKSKKHNGEIVAECWVVSIVQVFASLWEGII